MTSDAVPPSRWHGTGVRTENQAKRQKGHRVVNVIGIDIGGTHFRVGLFDDEGRRLLVFEDETLQSRGRDWMLEKIRERLRVLMSRTDYPPKACGMSFGGPVDYQRQLVSSIHSPGWVKFPLAQWAQKTLNLPCRVDNDANAGARGEVRYGAGRAAPSVVYITLSTGGRVGFRRQDIPGKR